MHRDVYRSIRLLAILCLLGLSDTAPPHAVGQSTPSPKAQPVPPVSEGEKMLVEMERKLLDAKSLRIKFEIDDVGLILGLNASGTIEMNDGNRCRTEAKAELKNPLELKKKASVSLIEVCDGLRNRTVIQEEIDDTGKPVVRPLPEGIDVPKHYNQLVMKAFSRAGSYLTYLRFGASSPARSFDFDSDRLDLETKYPRDRFKAVAKERLADADSFKVEWSMERTASEPGPKAGCMFCRPLPAAKNPEKAPPEKKILVQMIVWLDATTKLPIKRAWYDGGKRVLVERYTSIEINPRLDPARFVLPKEK